MTGIRFKNIEKSCEMIKVCVALHNYIVLNEENPFDIPRAFNEGEDELIVEEAENQEMDQEFNATSTSEKLMRKYFQNPQ